MARKTPITVDALWQLERLGNPSLSPDGEQAVCSLASHSMDENKSRSVLRLRSGHRPLDSPRSADPPTKRGRRGCKPSWITLSHALDRRDWGHPSGGQAGLKSLCLDDGLLTARKAQPC